MTLADHLQLWIAILALPVTVVFIVRFGRPSEKFWRSWFGVSLMLIAIAILLAETNVVLYRIYGPEFTGRDTLRISAQVLTLIAMGLRTWVLIVAQKGDTRRPHRMR